MASRGNRGRPKALSNEVPKAEPQATEVKRPSQVEVASKSPMAAALLAAIPEISNDPQKALSRHVRKSRRRLFAESLVEELTLRYDMGILNFMLLTAFKSWWKSQQDDPDALLSVEEDRLMRIMDLRRKVFSAEKAGNPAQPIDAVDLHMAGLADTSAAADLIREAQEYGVFPIPEEKPQNTGPFGEDDGVEFEEP